MPSHKNNEFKNPDIQSKRLASKISLWRNSDLENELDDFLEEPMAFKGADSVKGPTQQSIGIQDIDKHFRTLYDKTPVYQVFKTIVAYALTVQKLNKTYFRRKKEETIEITETDVVASLIHYPILQQKLFDLTPEQTRFLKFPAAVLAHCKETYSAFLSKRTYQIDGFCQDDYSHLHELERHISIFVTVAASELLNLMFACDKKSGELQISQLFKCFVNNEASLSSLYMHSSFTKDTKDFLNQFCNSNMSDVERFKRRKYCQQFVANKSVVFERLSPGIASILRGTSSKNTNVAGVLTILGEKESGKTHSARLICKAINQYMPNRYEVLKYDLENYHDSKNLMKLMGSGSQYTDSSLGEITRAIEVYPYRIFVFENADSAAREIQSFINDIITSGRCTDFTTSRQSSAHQCFFIFTQSVTKRMLNGVELENADPTDLLNLKEMGLDERLAATLTNAPVVTLPKLNSIQINHIVRNQIEV